VYRSGISELVLVVKDVRSYSGPEPATYIVEEGSSKIPLR
jgi:hypothetical protein